MNIYYDPQKFGLTVVGEVDFAGSYSFDTVAVWKDAQGRLVWTHDSGCSCPVPFEDRGLDSLETGTPADLQGFLEKQRDESAYVYDDEDRSRADSAITDLMAKVLADD